LLPQPESREGKTKPIGAKKVRYRKLPGSRPGRGKVVGVRIARKPVREGLKGGGKPG